MSGVGVSSYGILLGNEEAAYNPAVIYDPTYQAVPTSVDWNLTYSVPQTLCITNKPQALSAFKNDLKACSANWSVPGTLTAAAGSVTGSMQAGQLTTPLLNAAVASVTSLTIGGTQLGPLAFSTSYSALTGTPTLAAVARTGSWSDIQGKPTWGAVAYSNAYSDLTGLPSLGKTAYTNLYSDLSGLPSIPLGTQWAGTVGGTISYAGQVTVGSLTSSLSAGFVKGLTVGTAEAVRWDASTAVGQNSNGSLYLQCSGLTIGNSYLIVGPAACTISNSLQTPKITTSSLTSNQVTVAKPVTWCYLADGQDVQSFLGLQVLPATLFKSGYSTAAQSDLIQADGTFKAPRGGLYSFSCNVRFDSAASEIALILQAAPGCTAFPGNTRLAASSGTVGSVCIAWTGVLNANDSVLLAVYSSSSNTITAGPVTGGASMCLIHDIV